jgi:hypothetical protein
VSLHPLSAVVILEDPADKIGLRINACVVSATVYATGTSSALRVRKPKF